MQIYLTGSTAISGFFGSASFSLPSLEPAFSANPCSSTQ
jgi:hypothetical protein